MYPGEIGCGGTLIGINQKHVITAAHCVPPNPIFGKLEHVIVGEHDQADENDGQESIKIKGEPIVHNKWNSSTCGKDHYDLAIIVLEKEVSNRYARNAKLPHPGQIFEKADVDGWGQTRHAGPLSLILRTVTLDILDQDDMTTNPRFKCNGLAGCFNIGFNLCGENLQDPAEGTCGGDSGGPWTHTDYAVGKTYLVGVHMAGICKVGFQHQAIRVSNPDILAWIKSTMEHNS